MHRSRDPVVFGGTPTVKMLLKVASLLLGPSPGGVDGDFTTLSFGQINRQSTEKCQHKLLVRGIAVREVSPAYLIRPRRWLVPVVFAPSGDGCDAGDFFFFSVP